jgi:hypothetical protein
MSESLGKKDFGKVGLLAIVLVEKLNRENGGRPSNSRKALEQAMSSDLLKLSRREIEDMAVKYKTYSWGYYVRFTNDYIKSKDLFTIPYYKRRTSDLVLSDIELIQEVEANDNIESFFYIGSYLTKDEAIARIKVVNFNPSPINTLDIKHIKYLADDRVS